MLSSVWDTLMYHMLLGCLQCGKNFQYHSQAAATAV